MNIVMIGSFAFAPKATVTSSAATASPRHHARRDAAA